MTVCIAAICAWSYDGEPGSAIVAASDRMWTDVGSGQGYEPPLRKLAHLSRSIMAFVSGDMLVHTHVTSAMMGFGQSEATDLRVDRAAALYGEYVREYRRNMIEQRVLSVYGLTMDTFIDRAPSMHEAHVSRINSEIDWLKDRYPASAIIAGIDPDGMAHIYEVDSEGVANCYDNVGFVGIGAGAQQATSEFKSRRYFVGWSFVDALHIAHLGKKNAEIVAGVGRLTDMTLITRDGSERIDTRTVVTLDRHYDIYERRRTKLESGIVKSIVKELAQQNRAEVTAVSAAPAPADGVDPQVPHGIREEGA